MIEIEKRYKVRSTDDTVAALKIYGVIVTAVDHLIDRWFVPRTIRSLADEGRWFDEAFGVAYRIRERTLQDGSLSVVLESKQIIRPHDHSAFKENVIMTGSVAEAEKFLADKEYYNWLTIDKVRHSFSSPDPSLLIILDTIKGIKSSLGFDTVLEIEYDGEASSEAEAIRRISSLAAKLGLNEKDVYAKSLTVEAKPVLAQFI